MAIPSVRVIGKVYDPSGAGVGGEIQVVLNEPGSVTDGSNDHVIGGIQRFIITQDGDVDFEIVPNEVIITQSGSVSAYVATYKTDTYVWKELWYISTIPTILDIGDIVVLRLVSGDTGDKVVAIIPTQQITVDSVSNLPTPSEALIGVVALVIPATGETSTYTCHRTSTDSYEWVYGSGAITAQQQATTLPPTTGYAIGDTVLVDAGTGATNTWQLHRNERDVNEWVMVSTGGS